MSGAASDPAPYYRHHVFCCTNERPEGHHRGCCAAKDIEFRTWAAEIKLRAERMAGEMLAGAAERGFEHLFQPGTNVTPSVVHVSPLVERGW